MQRTETIYLEESATGLPRTAELITGADLTQLAVADSQWQPFLVSAMSAAINRGVARYDLPEHRHWEWERKARAMGAESLAFAIEADAEIQALMIVRNDKRCRLPEQFAESLVYIDYLATAPWNLPGLVTATRYRRSGRALIEAAIEYSISVGSQGRIGLHSLRGAEGFYRDHLSMRDLGIDPGYENLRYFEMTADVAVKLIQEI